jgi:Ras homolog gene family, member A
LNELSQNKIDPVKTEDGKVMADKINAFTYVECSAKTKEVKIEK